MFQKILSLLPKSLLSKLRAWRAANRASKFEGMSMQQTFTEIFRSNHWNGKHSVSGTGSDPENTEHLGTILSHVVNKHHIQSLFDCPCGDFFWMKNLVSQWNVRYTGADIVPDLVIQNERAYANDHVHFLVKNMVEESWEKADLALCRDGLVHLSFADALRAIEQLKQSGCTYVLLTTFPKHTANYNITTGEWRALNMERAPFSFPPPMALYAEKPTDGYAEYADKALGLWKVSDLIR